MNKTTQIYGIRTIIEAIHSEEPIDKVFLQKGLKGDLYRELEGLMRKKGINNSYVPIEKLNRLTKNNHQGAVATISPIAFYELEQLVESVMETNKTPLFLILDQLSDVRNFGAIIRTAECTGVDGIINQKKSGGHSICPSVRGTPAATSSNYAYRALRGAVLDMPCGRGPSTTPFEITISSSSHICINRIRQRT